MGFSPPSYFTTSLEDAEYYAATGGEEDLQRREEEYFATMGRNARQDFYPDLWDMYKSLYPRNQYPIVVIVAVPRPLFQQAQSDSGAEGAIVFHRHLPSSIISKVITVQWE